MIAFKQDTEITFVTEFDFKADEITGEETELFKAGEPIDAEIIDEEDGLVTLECGDGSLAYSIPRNSFDVI